MVLVKILGATDITAAIVFLMFIFGTKPFVQFILFCAGLLFIKGFFIIGGDVLSIIDIIASIFLILSIFLTLPAILLWIPAFLLLAKGFVSFI